MEGQQQPTLDIIAGRPTTVLPELKSIDGVLVQCRLPNGFDAYVPLKELLRLFGRDLASELRTKGGVSDGDKW